MTLFGQNQVAANDSITMFTTEMDARLVQQLQAEMDARNAQVQQQLGERDAEIHTLRRELKVRN